MNWPSAIRTDGPSRTCAWRSNRWTLIELLFACAIVVGVSATVSQVAYRVTLFSRRAAADVLMQQRVGLIHREWRRFVHDTEPAEWEVTDGVFRVGEGRARITDGQMVFTDFGREWTMPVTRNGTAEFAVERPPDGPPVAVLNLTWQFGPGPRHAVRLVACPPREEGQP